MLAQYDEDLQNNSFYKEIVIQHQDLINKAVEEGWIICIPREGSTTTSITIDDILDHILIPDIELPASHYATLSKKRVVVQNKIISLKNHTACHNVQILFEETVYNADMFKYTVWCIEQPLNRNVCCDDDTNNYCGLVTIQDCIEFLCINAGETSLSQIHFCCENFLKEHADFVNCPLEQQKQLIQELLKECIETCLKKEDCSNDIASFKLAVETCMQSYLKGIVLNGIAAFVANEEAEFNKIVQNLSDVDHQDLEIPSVIGDRIFLAKCELNKINKHSTTLGKLVCLRNTFDILSHSKNTEFTSDDLLQILVYLIIKLQINNWLANLKYITEFRFSVSDLSDENSFLIASLEAAILYIKNGSIIEDVVNKKTDNDDLSVFVKNSDLLKIEFVLKNNKNENRDFKLCHPLCSCSKCEGVLEGACQPTTNEKGQSLLHLAIFYNKVDVVEFLVEKQCEVNVVDGFFETPLHYAAKKGLQNILLFLVQSGAKVNEKNSDGNTPLHLAANNGHKRCVKALIYSTKTIDVNVKNNSGNTPLHIACKWGYLNIVKVLIESGATINVNNYAKLTPKDVALNQFVCQALNCDNNQPVKQVTFSEDVLMANTTSLRKKHAHGVRPKNIEQQKRLELLLKAIENNDTPLTCFYLGFPNPSSTLQTNTNSHHPLCSCEQHCQNFIDSLTFEQQQKTHCNIVNLCNSEGYTPLHVAAKHGRTDILRLLLDAGATVNVKTYKSLYTPLHLACMYQKLTVVKELLKCGECNVDVQDSRGNTPLFYACCKNDVRVFEVLLAHGADVKIKNYDSVSVLYEAERKMLSQILKLLKGVKPVGGADELFG